MSAILSLYSAVYKSSRVFSFFSRILLLWTIFYFCQFNSHSVWLSEWAHMCVCIFEFCFVFVGATTDLKRFTKKKKRDPIEKLQAQIFFHQILGTVIANYWSNHGNSIRQTCINQLDGASSRERISTNVSMNTPCRVCVCPSCPVKTRLCCIRKSSWV